MAAIEIDGTSPGCVQVKTSREFMIDRVAFK